MYKSACKGTQYNPKFKIKKSKLLCFDAECTAGGQKTPRAAILIPACGVGNLRVRRLASSRAVLQNAKGGPDVFHGEDEVCGGVAAWVEVAFDHFAGLEAYNHHVFGFHLVVLDAAGLDCDESFLAVDA